METYYIRRSVLSATALIFSMTVALPATDLSVFPAPAGITASSAFQAKANGQSVFVYSANNYQSYSGFQTVSFAIFDFANGSVDMEVTRTGATITSGKVMPKSYGIASNVAGGKVTFTLAAPRKVCVEVNDDRNNILLVFAGEPVAAPSQSDPTVLYYGPGTTDIGANFNPGTRKNIFLAGGAYVRGSFKGSAGSYRIWGHGVLSGETNPDGNDIRAIDLYGGATRVEGITVTNFKGQFNYPSPLLGGWGPNAVVRDLRIVRPGCNMNGGGSVGGIWTGDHGLVEDCFSLTDDDNYYLEGISFTKIKDCVSITRGGGAPIQIGWGSTQQTINDTVSGFDIIYGEIGNDWGGNEACIWSPNGGGAAVNNILVENVRCEGNVSRLFGLCALSHNIGGWGVTGPTELRNLTFRNIAVLGGQNKKSVLQGYDASHQVRDITFENVTINGVLLTSANSGTYFNMSNTSNIRFTTGGTSTAPAGASPTLLMPHQHAHPMLYDICGRRLQQTEIRGSNLGVCIAVSNKAGAIAAKTQIIRQER